MQKAKFKELYDYCQTLQPKVSRKSIAKKLLEIFPDRRLKVVFNKIDKAAVRGFFLSFDRNDINFVRQAGGADVIVVPRDLNYCWERYIITKEMMHLFDEEGECVINAEDFEGVLEGFATPSLDMSSQMESDILGMWMALGCLCPEARRLELKEHKRKGQTNDYAIAAELKIPELLISSLLDDNFENVIANLIS